MVDDADQPVIEVSVRVSEFGIRSLKQRVQTQGISESIRPRSRNGPPACRNPVLEAAPEPRAMDLMSISLRYARPEGAIGASLEVKNAA